MGSVLNGKIGLEYSFSQLGGVNARRKKMGTTYVSDDFFDEKKDIDLGDLMGWSADLALASVIRLWRASQSSLAIECNARQVAVWTEFKYENDRFIEALISTGLLKRKG